MVVLGSGIIRILNRLMFFQVNNRLLSVMSCQLLLIEQLRFIAAVIEFDRHPLAAPAVELRQAVASMRLLALIYRQQGVLIFFALLYEDVLWYEAGTARRT